MAGKRRNSRQNSSVDSQRNSRAARPVFAVSDLHVGDGGPRDNFAVADRRHEFTSFLDFVEREHGRLVIVGDLFELWQTNVSKAITVNADLLDRLALLKAVYVLGNHDADLSYFIRRDDRRWLCHPFFRQMCASYDMKINGRVFHFLHGHEVDRYCSDDSPGFGRITAIYTGLKEDRNNGPMHNKYRSVEQRTLGRWERLTDVWRRLTGQADRYRAMNRQLLCLTVSQEYDVIVCGHTHRSGRIDSWLYNCGTWAEGVCSFVQIDPSGGAAVFDWVDGEAEYNPSVLPG